jgi:putative transposase
MDVQKVTAEYRLSQWAQVIKARQESGQTIKDFCQTAGISRYKYFYWQRKLREIACTELAKTEGPSKNTVPHGWVQLAPGQKHPLKGTLVIEVNGCNITVNSGTDTELLKETCRVLKSL